jgi:hypothetical protein
MLVRPPREVAALQETPFRGVFRPPLLRTDSMGQQRENCNNIVSRKELQSEQIEILSYVSLQCIARYSFNMIAIQFQQHLVDNSCFAASSPTNQRLNAAVDVVTNKHNHCILLFCAQIPIEKPLSRFQALQLAAFDLQNISHTIRKKVTY